MGDKLDIQNVGPVFEQAPCIDRGCEIFSCRSKLAPSLRQGSQTGLSRPATQIEAYFRKMWPSDTCFGLYVGPTRLWFFKMWHVKTWVWNHCFKSKLFHLKLFLFLRPKMSLRALLPPCYLKPHLYHDEMICVIQGQNISHLIIF
jgi:hypothetical protein